MDFEPDRIVQRSQRSEADDKCAECLPPPLSCGAHSPRPRDTIYRQAKLKEIPCNASLMSRVDRLGVIVLRC